MNNIMYDMSFCNDNDKCPKRDTCARAHLSLIPPNRRFYSASDFYKDNEDNEHNKCYIEYNKKER